MARKKYIESVSIIHLVCCGLDTHKDKISTCLIYKKDNGVLADNLQRLGRLVTDFPEINEIDLNPIKGNGTDHYTVDARIIIA